MKITTLGTSHGDHTYCRFNSSTLFEIGDRHYLVDAGEPVSGLMVRAGKDIERLRAVFITHMHQDHVGGLPDLLKWIIKYPHEEQHVEVFLPEASAFSALGAWLTAMHFSWPTPMVSSHVVRDGPLFDDGALKVTAAATDHLRGPDGPITFAYVLEAEGKRIVSTGDLRADFSDFPQAARQEPCDLCICEMTHFQPETARPVLEKCPIKRLVLNHIHDPWHGDGELRLRGLLASLPYPWHIAHDGDVFEV